MTRTITTAAELDALPVGSVVMWHDEDGWALAAVRWPGAGWRVTGSEESAETGTGTWVVAWAQDDGASLTVLHDPSAPVVPSSRVEDVVKVLMDHAHDEGINACECGEWAEWDEEDWDARASAWSAHVHDSLLARFTITPRTDR